MDLSYFAQYFTFPQGGIQGFLVCPGVCYRVNNVLFSGFFNVLTDHFCIHILLLNNISPFHVLSAHLQYHLYSYVGYRLFQW